MSHVVEVPPITISSGQTTSVALSTLLSEGQIKVLFGGAVDMIVYAPAALTGTVTVQYSPKSSPAAGDWKTVQVSGSDLTFPAAKATSVFPISARDLRFVSSGAEGADRVFAVNAVLTVM